jgi:hypothetical protein
MPKIAQEAAGAWVPAGSLANGRHEHSATLRSDGRVLIVGDTRLGCLIQDYANLA